jgi:hypothetical protein
MDGYPESAWSLIRSSVEFLGQHWIVYSVIGAIAVLSFNQLIR